MDATVKAFVRERAESRCEYCGLHQHDAPFARFHIEHIIPRQHGGGDDPENLALACHRCNLKKGPNLTGIDEVSGEIVPLYHPRRQKWAEHLTFDHVYIVGLTPTGRATIAVLDLNAANRIELRLALRASIEAGSKKP